MVTHRDSSGKSTSATRNRFVSLLSETFLPEGFPQSVTADYLTYQTWDTVQALCSSVTGTLSTRSILRGVGVGSAEANLVSGTISWALRDGMSMVSRICFASRVATDLDFDAKRWRYVADITNDIALLIEIFSSYLPEPWMFLCAICIASLFKAVTGVAGGGSKASLTHHFALRDNTADLSAKEGSQETAAGLIGVALGMLTAWLVPDDHYWYTLLVVGFFTSAHLYANYRAVTSLVLQYLNKQRCGIVMGHYLNVMMGQQRQKSKGNDGQWLQRILTPKDVRRLEGVLSYHPTAKASLPLRIHLGAALSDFLETYADRLSIATTTQQVLGAITANGYALFYVPSNERRRRERSFGMGRSQRDNEGTYWAFFPQSHPEAPAVLGAVFHAMFHRHATAAHNDDGGDDNNNGQAITNLTDPLLGNNNKQQHSCGGGPSGEEVARAFGEFSAEATEAGWLLNRAQLRLDGWGVTIA